jgi:hypothetical protein
MRACHSGVIIVSYLDYISHLVNAHKLGSELHIGARRLEGKSIKKLQETGLDGEWRHEQYGLVIV